MRARHLLFAALLALLALPTSALAQPRSGIVRPANEEALSGTELGSQLYAPNCSLCHGIDARGIRVPRKTTGGIMGAGPSLRGVGAGTVDFYLRTGYMPLSKPGEQPSRGRPAFTDREIKALTAYISSLSPGGDPIPTPHPEQGNLAEGLQLFTEHCSGCHQVVAQGGVVTGAKVPPLGKVDATEIAESVRTGPFLMPKFPHSQISDAQLDSIIRYVLLAQHPVDRGGWGIGNLGPYPEGMVTWIIGVVAFIVFCVIIGTRLRS